MVRRDALSSAEEVDELACFGLRTWVVPLQCVFKSINIYVSISMSVLHVYLDFFSYVQRKGIISCTNPCMG